MSLILFLLKATGISLSGVMAPGPVTAATLAAGGRRKHAGLLIAAGHGLVELPLVILIMAGMRKWFEFRPVQISIGLAGGVVLVWMGIQMLRQVRQNDPVNSTGYAHSNPIWIGIALTAGNPYFLLWWVSVGLALAIQAWEFGVLAFGLFAIVHWLCDLAWLEVLSQASFKGTQVMGPRIQRVVLIICGIALLFFGCLFLQDAGKKLIL
jgi:threonine/homoserine/homoserine lactone efflux protein